MSEHAEIYTYYTNNTRVIHIGNTQIKKLIRNVIIHKSVSFFIRLVRHNLSELLIHADRQQTNGYNDQ